MGYMKKMLLRNEETKERLYIATPIHLGNFILSNNIETDPNINMALIIYVDSLILMAIEDIYSVDPYEDDNIKELVLKTCIDLDIDPEVYPEVVNDLITVTKESVTYLSAVIFSSGISIHDYHYRTYFVNSYQIVLEKVNRR